jgi:hypothetical protein
LGGSSVGGARRWVVALMVVKARSWVVALVVVKARSWVLAMVVLVEAWS